MYPPDDISVVHRHSFLLELLLAQDVAFKPTIETYEEVCTGRATATA